MSRLTPDEREELSSLQDEVLATDHATRKTIQSATLMSDAAISGIDSEEWIASMGLDLDDLNQFNLEAIEAQLDPAMIWTAGYALGLRDAANSEVSS